MSGFSPVSSGNPPQALTAAQLQQLNAIASMAKGSRFFEGKNGGEGFMGSFVDSTTGLTHYVKMLTHNNERKAFPGQNEQQMLDSQKNKNDDVTLGTMSKSLENDLRALAGRVGKENQFENLLKGRKDGFKTLMTRKFVAQVISLIGNAHNELAKSAKQLDALGRSDAISGTRDLFNWKAVAHAGKEKSTDFTSVLKDAKSMATGLRPESGRKTAIAGENHQQSMEAILKNPSPSSGDIKTFIDNLKNNYCPREWVIDLNEGSKTLQKGLPENVNARKFIAGLLEDALKDENVSKSLGMNSLAAAWNSVKSAVRLFSKLPFSKLPEPDNVQEQDLKAHFKVLVGVGALPKGSSEFEQKLLKFAGKCARGGLADVVSADIAKGPASRVRMSVLKMHSSLDNNARGYEAGFNTLLNEFNKEVWPNAGQPQPNVERPRQNVAPNESGEKKVDKMNSGEQPRVYTTKDLAQLCEAAQAKLNNREMELNDAMDGVNEVSLTSKVNDLKQQLDNLDEDIKAKEKDILRQKNKVDDLSEKLTAKLKILNDELINEITKLRKGLANDETDWRKLTVDKATNKILELLPNELSVKTRSAIVNGIKTRLSGKNDITKGDINEALNNMRLEMKQGRNSTFEYQAMVLEYNNACADLEKLRSDQIRLSVQKSNLAKTRGDAQQKLNKHIEMRKEVLVINENKAAIYEFKQNKHGLKTSDYMNLLLQLTDLAHGNKKQVEKLNLTYEKLPYPESKNNNS